MFSYGLVFLRFVYEHMTQVFCVGRNCVVLQICAIHTKMSIVVMGISAIFILAWFISNLGISSSYIHKMNRKKRENKPPKCSTTSLKKSHLDYMRLFNPFLANAQYFSLLFSCSRFFFGVKSVKKDQRQAKIRRKQITNGVTPSKTYPSAGRLNLCYHHVRRGREGTKTEARRSICSLHRKKREHRTQMKRRTKTSGAKNRIVQTNVCSCECVFYRDKTN